MTGISAIIDDLESGTSYEVQVRATNSKGDSGWSPTTRASTGTRYDVDGMYVYWTQTLGSEEPHEDILILDGEFTFILDEDEPPLIIEGLEQGNTLGNSCNTTESFRAFWVQPLESRNADEWEAEIFTEGGASNVRYTIQRNAAELTGTVRVDGFSIVALRVRGRYGDDWGTWSRNANLVCVVEPASGEPGSGELNVEEDEEEETEPLTARFEGLPEADPRRSGGRRSAFRLVVQRGGVHHPGGAAGPCPGGDQRRPSRPSSRVDDRSDLWEVRLTPESDAMVTVSLLPAADCDAAGAVCTEDGRMLSVGVARVILGPPPNSPATGQPSISGGGPGGFRR